MAGQDNSGRDPEEIRQEIQATRQRMSVAVDALEERLNPDRLKREATSAIREQTVGRVEHFADNASETVKGAGANVFETIKKNPLPAALAAIGLGWLLMESRNQNRMPSQQRFSEAGQYGRSDRYDAYGYRYGTPQTRTYEQGSGMRERGQQMAGQAQDKMQQVAGQAQDKAQHVADQAQDTAQQVAGQVQDTAQQVAGQVQDTAQQVANQAQVMVGQAHDQVSEWADTAQYQASQVGSRFQEVFVANPLLIGAAAMALGAAIGLSLPSTAKEDELMGDVRDNLMDTAQDKAQDTMQKVQQVATKATEAAKDAAKDEAEKQNLPTGS